jgi:tetratricopeptide (TPR) repeat protein
MDFFRKDVVEFALDDETRSAIEEQQALISADAANPRPYYQLAQIYRMQWKQDDALGLLLEAVRLDPAFAPAHAALAETYAVRRDMAAAWRHADAAAAHGDSRAKEMLERYGVERPKA